MSAMHAFRLSPQGEDPFGWFSAGCQCGACKGLKGFDDVLDVAEELALASTLLTVQRIDPDQPEEEYSTSEPGTDDFLAEELALAALLLSAMSKPFSSFVGEFDDLIQRSSVSESDILSLIEDARPGMEKLFDTIENDARRIVGKTISRGEAKLMEDALKDVLSKELVENGIVRATRYYTNNFFNTQIVPKIVSMMKEALDDPSRALSKPDFSSIKAMLDQRLKTVPYWRVVANAAASRGFHYGYLKTMEVLGVPGYRLVAVLDNRTSDICLTLNGKTFWVRDATNFMEEINSDDDPEAAKRRAPWKRASEVSSLTSPQLKALGVMVPPFHGNCRTTIRPVYGTPEII